MKEIVILLEEPSAREMLSGVLPRIVDESSVTIRYIVFEGKSDLEDGIEGKLRGYRNPQARFLVMRDQDAAPDCKNIKQRLVDKCINAGKPHAVVRIACRELETIYLADLAAVEAGLEMSGLAALQGRKGYRWPDSECGDPADRLNRVTNGNYQKVSGSRAIGRYLDLGNSRSASFKNLIAGLRRLASELEDSVDD